LRESLDLKKTINYLRRTGVRDDLIYLVLALVELGAADTPFFVGLESEEFLKVLSDGIALHAVAYPQRYMSGTAPEDFVEFLEQNEPNLKFNHQDLKSLMTEIRKQGEENYGFTKFKRLGETDCGPDSAADIGT
jgi:hypothetical protein